jgi:hypothetical protein
MEKISFDFDSTLTIKYIQDYAKELIDRNIDVWIVTSRYDDNNCKLLNESYGTNRNNDDLYKIVDNLGILRNKIVFTNMDDKYKFFENKDFIFHLDDDHIEIALIKHYLKLNVINHITQKDWKEICEKLLENEKEKYTNRI